MTLPTSYRCAKAYAVMVSDIVASPSKKMVLWQTKSAVQPRGPRDEWEKLKAMPKKVLVWANAGAAESKHRPGMVDTVKGTSADYRPLMTSLD